MKLNSGIAPREYQSNIAKSAGEKSTLVVLPTGTGKTLIAVMLAASRVEKYPGSKILMLAPTRPLVEQHAKSFRDMTDIQQDEISVLSGKINPSERKGLYLSSRVVVATPQTIENDLESGVLRLEDFSLLVVDECHRSVRHYAYPNVAKRFMLQSAHPLILGLTASPGSSREKINGICSSLFIDSVELRSEADDDISEYVQPIEKENVYVELPRDFRGASALLAEAMRDDVGWLKEKHYIPIANPPKRMLIDLQKKIMAGFIRGSRNPAMFAAMTKVIGAIKIQYMNEMLETQGASFAHEYAQKLESSKKRNDRIVMNDPRVREAVDIINDIYRRGVEHPKMGKLLEVVKGILDKESGARIICFANYRASVDKINRMLNENGVKSEILIGQAVKDGVGLSQKEQVETLRNFNDGVFNVLCGTSITEEGISIHDVCAVIFYDNVPSEIRKIQRAGRTGRTAPGKIIFLITKGTVDEAYYWTSTRKEARMKKIVGDMKNKGVVRRKLSLIDWLK